MVSVWGFRGILCGVVASLFRPINLGLSTLISAGRIVMLAMKLLVTATATSAPKRVSGTTSLVVNTPKPSVSAAKLNSSARPVEG